ncbi:hypothetical protein GCM10007874_45800 [Labrys miyagiensis]|uniref:Uncharacterized protein n=1 Tax=Labrys miyagiensis TaxID=346912 RepID=A0ABQ6CP67_9HYPH|nr:hypothetical protein [Labrys miyagiensis]GLS21563.1 hypothetical protein GCM10007874_45800 [Labrys miyagiensis]
MRTPDFSGPAEVYVQVPRSLRSMRGRTPQKYHRFESLALAVQFAVEKADTELTSVIIDTEDGEFTGPRLQSLYDDVGYPLRREGER